MNVCAYMKNRTNFTRRIHKKRAPLKRVPFQRCWRQIDSLLIYLSYNRPPPTHTHLSTQSGPPTHCSSCLTSTSLISSQLFLTGTQYSIVTLLFVFMMSSSKYSSPDSGVGTRHNLAQTKTLWWVATGHWSVVIRECGIFQH